MLVRISAGAEVGEERFWDGDGGAGRVRMLMLGCVARLAYARIWISSSSLLLLLFASLSGIAEMTANGEGNEEYIVSFYDERDEDTANGRCR